MERPAPCFELAEESATFDLAASVFKFSVILPNRNAEARIAQRASRRSLGMVRYSCHPEHMADDTAGAAVEFYRKAKWLVEVGNLLY
jgi:hypothetical protein